MTASGLRTCGAAALAAAVLSSCAYWHGDLERLVDQSERNFWLDADPHFKNVSLNEIAANPTSYKLMEVAFDAILDRNNEQVFLAFYSTVRQEDFIGFSVWPADAPLWSPAGRGRSIPTLYMSKDNRGLQTLLSAQRYAFLHIRGRVMNDFEQLPFISVSYVEELMPQAYTEESLVALKAGMDAAAQKRPAQAIENLDKAVKLPLTPAVRAKARLQLASLYEDRGDLENAAVQYEAVLWDDAENTAAWDGWKRCVAALRQKPRGAKP
jgi:tetratricopeptide (TPR) repeat protein